jgi:hypothetical protein
MVLCCCKAVEYFIFLTDWHTVDEDSRTIAEQSGFWIDNTLAGIIDRDLFHTPTTTRDTVASM